MPNLVDIIAVIVIVLCAVQGSMRGLSGELARLVGIVAAFIIGMICYGPVSAVIVAGSGISEGVARAIAFALVMICMMVASMFLSSILRKIMRIVLAPMLDRFLGCISGVLRSCIFVVIVILLMCMVPSERLNREFGEKSLLGRGLISLLPVARDKLEESGLQERLKKER